MRTQQGSNTEGDLRGPILDEEGLSRNLAIVNARLGVDDSTNPNTRDTPYAMAAHGAQFSGESRRSVFESAQQMQASLTICAARNKPPQQE